MPSIIPEKGQHWPQYFVLSDYGLQLGLARAETDPAKADRQTILKLLTHGEFTNPGTVIKVNLPAGTCRDVTAEIMDEVKEQRAAA